jgi:serine/threonine protein kinase
VNEIGSAANRYEILAKLAEGGMAEIFLARGATAGGIERHVVLKRILRDRAHDAELARMFLDEARLAAQLQHPNIAQVFDVGRLGESYFFTMEYVHGETVRALIKRSRADGTPVPIAEALSVIAGAAAGLHHAHERRGVGGKPLGIVHRDVSPSNLMVTYEGHVKVVDFGVAKAADRLQQSVSGSLKGKICYLAPEQCHVGDVDRRADVFALGIVMWELVTGEYLYRRDSDFLTLSAIVEEEPPPPSSRRRDISRELDELVLRLLAKQPAQRFQSAGAVVEAIETLAERSGFSLSANRLGRLMRERFGDKPEPWAELETGNPSKITVQSDPLGASPTPSPVEEQLRAMPTMTGMVDVDDEELKPTVFTGAPTHIQPTAMTVHDRPRSAVPPPPAKRPPVALIAGGVVAAGALVLALVRPWQHAVAPEDAHVVVPLARAIDAAPLPDSARPIDAAPPDAAPVDAAVLPDARTATVHKPRARHDAGADDCANDPMACQQ